MQKRARNVASTLNIFSTPGQGTQVLVKAKLEKVGLRKRLQSIVKGRFTNVPATADKH
jgi:hypothetical protein